MPAGEEEKKSVQRKLENLKRDNSIGNADKPKKTIEMLEATLTEDEMNTLKHIRAGQMLRFEDHHSIDNLTADIIDGRRINLERGSLGLVKPIGAEKKQEQTDMMTMPREVKFSD